MFFPEGRIRVFLYGAPVDMRKSFDGLYALARHGLQQDPLSGHLFVFVNRRATQMKVLYFDRSGWCVWAKRLEAGRFIAQWAGVSQARCWVHCRRNFNEALGVEPEAASWALRQIQQLYEVERQAREQCKEAALRRPAAAVDLARLLCLGKSADGSELENWTRSTSRCYRESPPR